MSDETAVAEIANDLAAQARWMRRLKSWKREADIFERGAATIRDLVATGRTRRRLWAIHGQLWALGRLEFSQDRRAAQMGKSARRGADTLARLAAHRKPEGAAC